MAMSVVKFSIRLQNYIYEQIHRKIYIFWKGRKEKSRDLDFYQQVLQSVRPKVFWNQKQVKILIRRTFLLYVFFSNLCVRYFVKSKISKLLLNLNIFKKKIFKLNLRTWNSITGITILNTSLQDFIGIWGRGKGKRKKTFDLFFP